MPEQSRKQLVADTEDQHRQETGHVHVGVGRTVDDPLGVHRDPDAEGDPGREPEHRRPNEPFDEPFHVVSFLDSTHPTATGRVGSVIHSLHDPAYSLASPNPACAIANTSCAAVTP